MSESVCVCCVCVCVCVCVVCVSVVCVISLQLKSQIFNPPFINTSMLSTCEPHPTLLHTYIMFVYIVSPSLFVC